MRNFSIDIPMITADGESTVLVRTDVFASGDHYNADMYEPEARVEFNVSPNVPEVVEIDDPHGQAMAYVHANYYDLLADVRGQ